MTQVIPVPFLILTVALLIRAKLKGDARRVYLWKPLSTLLVIAVCALSLARPDTNALYTVALLVGLLFSLGGDVALMFSSEKAFLLGVASFLLAHVVYGLTFAFGLMGGLVSQQLLPAVILLIVGAGFYAYLYPHLGKMKAPVGLYALVISLMVLTGVGPLASAAFSSAQAWLVAVGAILFYVSDMILAVDRFARPFKLSSLFNLSTYYLGQLLIALSAAYALAK